MPARCRRDGELTSRRYFLDTHEHRAENLWVVRSLRFGIFAFFALLAACRGGGDAAPPCSAAAAKFLEIAKYDLASARVDEATARAVADQLPAMRDALSSSCTNGNWNAATRKCLVHANDHAGLEACEQQLTDEQRRDLDRATRGTPRSL
jgi:hypothetical protein